ncbi:MAG: hypothetical protein NC311_07710 [Muribaculaceae bacterium]|nr:hypothetical protein [Muribaculaceae bacterium]
MIECFVDVVNCEDSEDKQRHHCEEHPGDDVAAERVKAVGRAVYKHDSDDYEHRTDGSYTQRSYNSVEDVEKCIHDFNALEGEFEERGEN